MKSKGMRLKGHTAGMGEKRNAYKISLEKPERRRPLTRPSHGLKDIKMDLTTQNGVEWTGLISFRIETKWTAFGNTKMNHQVS
jgi:hypothetical protein